MAVASGMALALSGCGGSPSGGGSGQIAAVVKGLDNPFFQSMESGINEQASTSDVKVTVQAANSITDTTGQADKLSGLAGQDFSLLHREPDHGHQPDPGHRCAVGEEHPDRQHRQPDRRGGRQGGQREDRNLHRHRQHRRRRPGCRRDGQAAARRRHRRADRRHVGRRHQCRGVWTGSPGGSCRQPRPSSRRWPPTGNARWP